ncbi:MAG: hypothetical protein LIQ31_05550 [Planctomycetes bacterium]|nr:hypothetical protein [Planctomycetota bacterium]
MRFFLFWNAYLNFSDKIRLAEWDRVCHFSCDSKSSEGAAHAAGGGSTLPQEGVIMRNLEIVIAVAIFVLTLLISPYANARVKKMLGWIVLGVLFLSKAVFSYFRAPEHLYYLIHVALSFSALYMAIRQYKKS